MSDRTKTILAFATVYIVWGSTYFAIKVGLETLPPFLMAGTRFLLAGGIMALWSRLRGDPKATPRQWRAAAIVGTLLLVFGNGGVTWAETRIASGIAALLVAIEPVWIVMLEWRMGRRNRLSLGTVAGLALGIAGVALLMAGRGMLGPSPILPMVAVLLAALAWAYGSLYGQRADLPESPIKTNGMQMLVGGGAMFLLGLGLGEGTKMESAHISLASVGALAYLTIFGSLMAFSAYVYLVRNVPPTMAATYSYVNPAVAVLLGGAFGEPFGIREGFAMVLILVGLYVLNRAETTRLARSEPEEASSSPRESVSTSYPRRSRIASGSFTPPEQASPPPGPAAD